MAAEFGAGKCTPPLSGLATDCSRVRAYSALHHTYAGGSVYEAVAPFTPGFRERSLRVPGLGAPTPPLHTRLLLTNPGFRADRLVTQNGVRGPGVATGLPSVHTKGGAPSPPCCVAFCTDRLCAVSQKKHTVNYPRAPLGQIAYALCVRDLARVVIRTDPRPVSRIKRRAYVCELVLGPELQGALSRTVWWASGTIWPCRAKFTQPKGIMHLFSGKCVEMGNMVRNKDPPA